MFHKRLKNAQPHDAIMRSKGAWGTSLNKRLEAIWIAKSIACYNMFDPQSGIAKVVPFNITVAARKPGGEVALLLFDVSHDVNSIKNLLEKLQILFQVSIFYFST